MIKIGKSNELTDVACAFTGHRPQNLPWGFDEELPGCVFFKNQLREQILLQAEKGVRHFLSGLALGVDTYAAEAVIELRKIFPITLEGVLPFKGQEGKWNVRDKERYYAILEHCDVKTVMCESYNNAAYFVRNRYLVDNSRVLIAGLGSISISVSSGSGTAWTVRYAREKGKEVVFVNHL